MVLSSRKLWRSWGPRQPPLLSTSDKTRCQTQQGFTSSRSLAVSVDKKVEVGYKDTTALHARSTVAFFKHESSSKLNVQKYIRRTALHDNESTFSNSAHCQSSCCIAHAHKISRERKEAGTQWMQNGSKSHIPLVVSKDSFAANHHRINQPAWTFPSEPWALGGWVDVEQTDWF